MTRKGLAPVVALALTFAGSLAAAEDETPAPAAQAEVDAAATAAPTETAATPADAPPAEAAPQADDAALGPVGHDAQGRAGRIHVVVKGDTLWDISDAYLGTPWVWPSIWRDNTAEVENPHRIYPGERIWISPYEMRKVSDAEAAEMLAREPSQPAEEPMPAAMGDPVIAEVPTPGEIYRYQEIETTGFVTKEELEGAGSVLDSPTVRTLLSDNLSVQIGLGKGEVAVGDQFEIFRPGDFVVDPATGKQLGRVTQQLGWLEVTAVHDQSATGFVRQARGDILRGDHVLPRQVRGEDIPVGGRVEVEGMLAHTPYPRVQMGNGDVVYLNRGAHQGLAIGTPLEVYEQRGEAYDAVRKEKRALPDHVIAKLIVVDAHDDTAVAVVTSAETELNRGFRFRGSDSIH